MAIDSHEFPQICTVGIIRRCMELGSVLQSGLFEPKQDLHFWGLHSFSFLLIYTLHWCKHGNMAIGSPEFRKVVLSSLYGAA